MGSVPGWQPQQSGAQEICNLLAAAQLPGANQKQIVDQLDQYSKFPEFNNYLSFLFATADSQPVEIRQAAGLLLKNNLKKQWKDTSAEFRTYIKEVLVNILASPVRVLRHTGSTIISEVVGAEGLEGWPTLVAGLVHCLQSNQPEQLDGALNTLYKLAEDHPIQYDVKLASSDRVGGLLVPILLSLLASPLPHVRDASLTILNTLAPHMPVGLLDHLEQYVQGLFTLALDPEAAVRKQVCIGLVQMLGLRPDLLLPNMQALIDYIMERNKDPDPGVAREACEFWVAFAESAGSPEMGLDASMLRPHLQRLLPLLLSNMVFEEYDDEVQAAEDAEAKVLAGRGRTEDSDADMAPFASGGSRAHNADADDLGDDGEGEGGVRAWTLRKSSATAIDFLSHVYNDDLLPFLLPEVQARLAAPDWRICEAALLALGAVSEGCHVGMMAHLDQLVAMLLPRVLDARPMVRIIAHWALSRYSHWTVLRAKKIGATAEKQLDDVVGCFLHGIMDRNKCVAIGAASALAFFAEHVALEDAGQLLEPRLQGILQQWQLAYTSGTRRLLSCLQDVLVQLVTAVGRSLARPDLISLYMPPLYAKFQSLPDMHRDLLALMECMGTVVARLGPAFEPYAPAVYQRCVAMVAVQLQASAAHSESFEPDFATAALDLLSGLAQGLGASMDPLVAGSGFMPILLMCCAHEDRNLRQFGLALVGDFATTIPGHLKLVVGELVPLQLRQLQMEHINQEELPACNNAAWSLGELAMRLSPEVLSPFALPAAERLAAILAQRMPRSITENATITLGRIASVLPETVAPHLAHFCRPWCLALRNMHDNVEKEDAFRGLCRVVQRNPEAALASWAPLCAAIVSWQHIGCEGLHNEIAMIMQTFKSSLDASGRWAQLWGELDEPVRRKLASVCHL